MAKKPNPFAKSGMDMSGDMPTTKGSGKAKPAMKGKAPMKGKALPFGKGKPK